VFNGYFFVTRIVGVFVPFSRYYILVHLLKLPPRLNDCIAFSEHLHYNAAPGHHRLVAGAGPW
jgi:hypothetical protein